MLWLTMKLAVAGIGHLLADYSIAVVIAGALIVGSFFVGAVPFLGKLRADMLWAAAFIIGCLLWGAHIEHDTNLHWIAKTSLIEKSVSKAVKEATSPGARTTKDPYDNPDN